MQKNYMALFFGLVMLFGMASCTKTETEKPSEDPLKTVVVETKQTPQTPEEDMKPKETPKQDETPAPKPTPTPTPTQTVESDTVYHTDFETEDNLWYIDKTGERGKVGVAGLENGRYWMSSSSAQGGYHVFLKYPQLSDITNKKNIAVETKIKLVAGTDQVAPHKVSGGLLWDYIMQEDGSANVFFL